MAAYFIPVFGQRCAITRDLCTRQPWQSPQSPEEHGGRVRGMGCSVGGEGRAEGQSEALGGGEGSENPHGQICWGVGRREKEVLLRNR